MSLVSCDAELLHIFYMSANEVKAQHNFCFALLDLRGHLSNAECRDVLVPHTLQTGSQSTAGKQRDRPDKDCGKADAVSKPARIRQHQHRPRAPDHHPKDPK